MVRKRNLNNVKKIIEVLKQHPNGLWIREIARQSSLHPEIVRRIITRYPEIFEEYADLTRYGVNLKFVRLKERDDYDSL